MVTKHACDRRRELQLPRPASRGKNAASSPHMNGSIVFVRLCQCAPLPNTCFPGHQNPHAKRHLYGFSRVCRAHGRQSLYFTMCSPFPLQSCPFAAGDLDSHLTHGLLSHLSPHPTRYLYRLSHFCSAYDRHRQTDKTCYFVSNKRLHLHT